MRTLITPLWFYGLDSFLEFLSIIIACFLVWFSYKSYKLTRQKKYLHFSMAFGLIVFAFINRILTHLAVFLRVDETLNATTQFLSISTIFYMVIMIIAYFLLFTVSLNVKRKWPFAFLLVIIFVYFFFTPNFLQVFHTISFALLILVTLAQSANFLKRGSISALVTCFSFAFIALAHLQFGLVHYLDILYFTGQLFQFVGYLGLFLTMFSVLTK